MDLSKKSDIKKLIKSCLRGERKSQHLLYETFYGKMLGVCMRYASDQAQAKDMLQEGFLKVFEKLQTYKYTGSFEGWVRRIIVNTSIDMLRAKSKFSFNEYEIDSLFDMPDDSIEATENNLEQLKLDEIMQLLQKLPPAYQAVFNMYVLDGYTHPEIAKELEISVGTSKSNLAKAKQKLRRWVQEIINEKANKQMSSSEKIYYN